MNKEYLRKKYQIIRKNIVNKSMKDKIIYNKIINNEILNKYDTVLIYVSLKNEVDTIDLIKYFFNKKIVAVPKIINNEIKFCVINNLNELKLGKFNILEPTINQFITCFDHCLCITPGLCFDKNNYRIGYGRGYYDRFFNCHKVFSIGLCYMECLVNKIDIDHYDYNVDMVITD